MTRRRAAAGVDEAAAREVLLLQAFEMADPPTPAWTVDDAAWATRAAREAAAGDDTLETFVARRASLALQRLRPRLAPFAPQRDRAGRWLAGAVVVGLVAGLGADAIGGSQRINLLAPPIWTVVAWNLAVYALVAALGLRRLSGAPVRRPGAFVRAVERLLAPGRRAVPPSESTATAAGRAFALRWSTFAAPLAAKRATVLLHVAAAALGAGLIGGLYARGLVLDYRVAWESTFLAAADVHAALTTLLAPASRLSGIALPDVAAVAALRVAHDQPLAGASAAPWIHLYAVTLVIAVVLPRLALAAGEALAAERAAARIRLPLAEPYFRRLDLARRGESARVRLRPYAQTPSPEAVATLRSLLAEVLGTEVVLELAPTTPFGGEDDVPDASGDAPTLVVALFDLAATPEPEHHGRFLAGLAAPVAVVDETAFDRRFGASDRRVAERRAAWSRLLDVQGAVPAFVNLGASMPAPAALASLRAALGAPPAEDGYRPNR